MLLSAMLNKKTQFIHFRIALQNDFTDDNNFNSIKVHFS